MKRLLVAAAVAGTAFAVAPAHASLLCNPTFCIDTCLEHCIVDPLQKCFIVEPFGLVCVP